VIWPIYGLKIDNVIIKLQTNTYCVIFMTSLRLRHRKYVIKVTSQNFPFSSLSLSKILVALLIAALDFKQNELGGDQVPLMCVLSRPFVGWEPCISK